MIFHLVLCSLHAPFEQTPPASPKTTEERGHQRTPSDAAASAVAGVLVSDASQQPQGANGDAALNQ